MFSWDWSFLFSSLLWFSFSGDDFEISSFDLVVSSFELSLFLFGLALFGVSTFLKGKFDFVDFVVLGVFFVPLRCFEFEGWSFLGVPVFGVRTGSNFGLVDLLTGVVAYS